MNRIVELLKAADKLRKASDAMADFTNEQAQIAAGAEYSAAEDCLLGASIMLDEPVEWHMAVGLGNWEAKVTGFVGYAYSSGRWRLFPRDGFVIREGMTESLDAAKAECERRLRILAAAVEVK